MSDPELSDPELSDRERSDPELGSIAEIDDRTVLVLGQPLDIRADQPDVANALVHRVGDTVFLVDTGVTEAFRTAVRTALDRVGPWNRLVLLTTHGHPDHVGNNDLVDEIAQLPGISVEHYLPARDLEQMRDPQGYWTECFYPLAGLAPLPAAPALVAIKITSLFTPYRAFGAASRTFEELPVETIRLGSQQLTGWTFADGAVSVWRTQGHCAGHVLVHLRDNQLLHLGDEANGPCAVMPDADQVKLTATHLSARRLIADGVVDTVTDGHTFEVMGAAAAAERLDRLVEQSGHLQRAAAAAVGGADTVPAGDVIERFTAAYRELGVAGANPNPVFTGMMAARHLEALGYRPGRADASRWHRAALETPPHGLETAARGLGGAAATVSWLAHGRQH